MKEAIRREPKKEKKERPKKNIVKVSEMMLSINGEYVSEIGNPSYEENERMFIQKPDGTITIDGTGKMVTVQPDDVVKIPHGYGHASFKQLLGETGERREFSGRAFEGKISEVFTSAERKYEKITELLGDNRDKLLEISKAVEKMGRTDETMVENYTPEQLFHTILDTKEKEHAVWSRTEEEKEKYKELIEGMKKIEIVSDDPEKSREAIVGYCYLHCEANNVDAANAEEILKHFETGEAYFFLAELLHEYDTQADSRFGDALLVGISQFIRRNPEEAEDLREEAARL